ncbi:MAG: hypothetical protein IJN34_00150, partial [Clostridia bacterium]|nr:hypothetical protein [Clostridia bacterium]
KGIMNDDDYYIVEDVFLSVQEKKAVVNTIYAIGRHMPKHYDYDIKFSHNGTHRIKLLSTKEPEKLEANYFAVFFSKPGDKFYLMISKRGENECIVKAFNSRYFKLVEEDFECIDGKYYPKKW